jgi:hypothetical protein
VNCFSAETTVGANVWGSENQMESPNQKIRNERTKARTKEGTRNPLKFALASKNVNPFTRALVPPFIGRRRDFYILRLPSNLENIHDVNIYIYIFYIVTPVFPKKNKCKLYACQDQVSCI